MKNENSDKILIEWEEDFSLLEMQADLDEMRHYLEIREDTK